MTKIAYRKYTRKILLLYNLYSISESKIDLIVFSIYKNIYILAICISVLNRLQKSASIQKKIAIVSKFLYIQKIVDSFSAQIYIVNIYNSKTISITIQISDNNSEI